MTSMVGGRGTGSQRGVSLLEVLVVLTILGIVAGAVAPALRRDVQPDDLESAAREVRQLIDRARRTAIDQAVPVTFLVDAAGSRYWMIAALARRDTVVVSGTLPLPTGISLASSTVRAAVRFSTTGAGYTHDELVLHNDAGPTRVATVQSSVTVKLDGR